MTKKINRNQKYIYYIQKLIYSKVKVTCIMFELTAKRKKKKWVQHETTINNPYTCNFV